MADVKSNTTFAYTLSSKYNMVSQAYRSIKSLQDYVDSEDIIVYFTPPRRNQDIETLESLGVEVRKEENRTEAFEPRLFGESRAFGEKISLCEIDSENLVVLDCDLIITGDIWDILEGDFDFKARPDDAGFDEDQWKSIFEKRGLAPLSWQPNIGFMVFKNNMHHKVQEAWFEYLHENIDYFYRGMQHKDAVSLSLGLSEKDAEIESMTRKEHWMEWTDKPIEDTYVHHLHTPTHWTFFQHFFISLDRNTKSLLSKIRYKLSKMF